MVSGAGQRDWLGMRWQMLGSFHALYCLGLLQEIPIQKYAINPQIVPCEGHWLRLQPRLRL